MHSPRRRDARAWTATCLALLIAAAAAGGCGAGASAACPSDSPADCPMPAPTYAADVAPLLTARCRGCHTAGGMSFNHPFDSYLQVAAARTNMSIQLQACLMPPADQPQLSAAERQLILAWLVCGAPDN